MSAEAIEMLVIGMTAPTVRRQTAHGLKRIRVCGLQAKLDLRLTRHIRVRLTCALASPTTPPNEGGTTSETGAASHAPPAAAKDLTNGAAALPASSASLAPSALTEQTPTGPSQGKTA